MPLTIGSLFSGYGGLDLAVEAAFSAETAWHCEWEDPPSQVLAHHWPTVPNYRDVTTVDWTTVPPVDIIAGGSPCQDLSLAGARKGMNDGTRSNLWESMREAIATIKPTYVVWENVRGALSATATSVSDMGPREGFLESRGGHLRALGRVLGDLADLGYDTQWCGLRAADVGAPHGRFRVFLLATRRNTQPTHTDDTGLERQRDPQGTTPPQRHRHVGPGADRSSADSERSDRGRQWTEQDGRGQPTHRRLTTPDAERKGQGDGRGLPIGRISANADPSARDSEEPETAQHPHSGGRGPRRKPGMGRPLGGRGNGPDDTEATTNPSSRDQNNTDWGAYGPAIRRWEAVRGTAPAPTELTPKGKHRLSARFAEWMMGVDPGWITDIPGITRNDQLKAAGNGVVPQQAHAALTHMLAQTV